MEVQGHKEYEIMPTIKPSVYKAMKSKTGSFKPKKKK
jgi:hypothetical protein